MPFGKGDDGKIEDSVGKNTYQATGGGVLGITDKLKKGMKSIAQIEAQNMSKTGEKLEVNGNPTLG